MCVCVYGGVIRGGGAEFYRHHIMTLHHQHFHWMHTYNCMAITQEDIGEGRRKERGREGGGEREGRCSPLA